MKKYLISLLGLFFIIIACSETTESFDYVAIKNSIATHVQEGDLLINVTKQNDAYLFTFENATVEVPADAISNIETDSEFWKTTLTFGNGSTYILPVIGTSIDNLIVSVTVNPSGYNPLAANVAVNLPVLGRIKIIVHSKEGHHAPDVEYAFKNIEKGQTVTVMGLYSNYNNKVTVIYTDKEGNERARSVIQIPTEKIDLPYLPTSLCVVKADVSKMESGMTLISSPGESEADTSIPYMVDADGEIRWLLDWSKSKELNHIGAQCGLFRMRNGNYVAGDFNNNQIVEVNMLGELVRRWDTTPLQFSFHHEIRETDNGKFLIATTQNGAKLIDGTNVRVLDHAVEFDPVSGSITKKWDFTQTLDSARIVRVDYDTPGSNLYGQSKSNWLHNNGINQYSDGSLLCTARWQGVFKCTYGGSLCWIIAPHNQWRESYHRYLLTPLDRNGQPITDEDVLNGHKNHPDFEWVWGVHCPIIMPNGHIMVFDNGYCRNFDSSVGGTTQAYSRAVEYEVDEANMTVRQVWQFGKERGSDCYAMAISGVQYLEGTGNRLFCPGMGNILSNGKSGARVIEVNPQTQQVVFELEMNGRSFMMFHRAKRISLYPAGL